jgi:hypothetical protein
MANQAREMMSIYRRQAERFEKQGDALVAAEYRQLATEQWPEPKRYTLLADSSE